MIAFVFCMPGAAVLDLVSPVVGANFDESVWFWPLLLLTSFGCWTIIFLLYCMILFIWKITAPMAGVLSYACVRGGNILFGIGTRMGVVSHASSNSSYVRTQQPSNDLSPPQRYEIIAERSFMGSVKLVMWGLYLVTTGCVQGAIMVLTWVMGNRALMICLTVLLAVLAIS
jgi:hypothetical protein